MVARRQGRPSEMQRSTRGRLLLSTSATSHSLREVVHPRAMPKASVDVATIKKRAVITIRIAATSSSQPTTTRHAARRQRATAARPPRRRPWSACFSSRAPHQAHVHNRSPQPRGGLQGRRGRRRKRTKIGRSGGWSTRLATCVTMALMSSSRILISSMGAGATKGAETRTRMAAAQAREAAMRMPTAT